MLGDYLGQSLEVDPKTCSKVIISHGRVKVLLGRVLQLSAQIPLLVGDLQIAVVVEMDAVTGEEFRRSHSPIAAGRRPLGLHPFVETWRKKMLTEAPVRMTQALVF